MYSFNFKGKCFASICTCVVQVCNLHICTFVWEWMWVYMHLWEAGCVKTHSVVEGEECSVAMLPCLLSCCSLGEDGRESVISSISSWDDWDLVFFLLNACLKELRNCKTENKHTGAKTSILPPNDVHEHIMPVTKSEFRWHHILPDQEVTLCCVQAMVTVWFR